MKARITLGTTWVGTDAETIEIEVEDRKEFDSDAFSTEILDAIFNRNFPHYWIDYELVGEEGDNADEDDVDEDEDDVDEDNIV